MSEHNHSHAPSSKNGLIISILLNSGIVIAEFIGGIISGSLSLLSDAVHNLSDVMALILAYIGEKFSKKKPNKNHTFAYKKVEVVIAFVNALFLLIVGLYIIYEAINKYFTSTIVINSQIMLWVAAIGFLGNFISILLLHKEKDENLNKKSAYLHLFFDTISSVMVILVGIIVHFYPNLVILDLIASILIALMVLKSGLGVFKQSLHILIQGVPAGIELVEIQNYLNTIQGIQGIHDLHVWNIDSNDMYLIVHIVIDKNIDTEKLIKTINEGLDKKYHIHHTSLQVVVEKCC